MDNSNSDSLYLLHAAAAMNELSQQQPSIRQSQSEQKQSQDSLNSSNASALTGTSNQSQFSISSLLNKMSPTADKGQQSLQQSSEMPNQQQPTVSYKYTQPAAQQQQYQPTPMRVLYQPRHQPIFRPQLTRNVINSSSSSATIRLPSISSMQLPQRYIGSQQPPLPRDGLALLVGELESVGELQQSSTSKVKSTRRHACTVIGCGLSFRRMEHLRRHARTHSGEKPYPCQMCSKKFSRSDNLAQHMKTHARQQQMVTQQEDANEKQDQVPDGTMTAPAIQDVKHE